MVKCTECGDYLHQYRRRLDQPHRIAALIGLIFAAIIVVGAFLPWVHVLESSSSGSPTHLMG